MHIIRSIYHRAKKHFFPKQMETNLELAQLDANKSSQKLIKLQKQELEIESKILQEIKVLKNSNSLDPQLANAIRNDLKHLTDSFKL